MKIRSLIKLITPPLIIDAYKKKRIPLSGKFTSWEAAKKASNGYETDIIIDKTKEAALKVKEGKVRYERDSIIYDKIQYSWPLLAGLMWVAAQASGKLNVLDFGGSLGTTYFQNRSFLSELSYIRWNIVEQPKHVKVGLEHFQDDTLKFYGSIQECLSETQPNVIILSSVLQYLEHPYKILDQCLSIDSKHVIIDKITFSDLPTDKLYVQYVRPPYYPASYPCWVFSKSKFLSKIYDNGFEIFAGSSAIGCPTPPIKCSHELMILRKSNC